MVTQNNGGEMPQERTRQAEKQYATNAARQRAQNNPLDLYQPDEQRPKTPPRRRRTPPPPKRPSFCDLALTACLCLPFPIIARVPSPPVAAARPAVNRDVGRAKPAPPTNVPAAQREDTKAAEQSAQMKKKMEKLEEQYKKLEDKLKQDELKQERREKEQREKEQREKEQREKEEREKEEREQEERKLGEQQACPKSKSTKKSTNNRVKEPEPELESNLNQETDDSGPDTEAAVTGPETKAELEPASESAPDSAPESATKPKSEPELPTKKAPANQSPANQSPANQSPTKNSPTKKPPMEQKSKSATDTDSELEPRTEADNSGPNTDSEATMTRTEPESEPASEPPKSNKRQGKKPNKAGKGKPVGANSNSNDNAVIDGAGARQRRATGRIDQSRPVMTSALRSNTSAHGEPVTSIMSEDDKVSSLLDSSSVTASLNSTLREQPSASASLVYGETGFAPFPIPQRHRDMNHEERPYSLGDLGGWPCNRRDEWDIVPLAPGGLAREASSSSLSFTPGISNVYGFSMPRSKVSNIRDSIGSDEDSTAVLGAWRARSSLAWSGHTSEDDDSDANDPFTEPGSIARNTPRPKWHY
ncbi:hypothetical protein PGQ11_005505 [Apiospora arundinis]|uniref:Uncharacterized protein n=1 Tax=Apiospora arundinis TaxID=335852 RepID=A0ABR2JBQ1_9PEZI